METSCINVTMEELTNELSLKNAYPVTDEVGENTKPFRFKLNNTCGVGVDYNLNLEVMGLVDEKNETNPSGKENRIASRNIAVKIDENAKSILSSNPSATPTYKESDYTAVESYTTYSGSINPYDSVTHEIRIWLDESATNETQNGKFYSKVVIEAKQNQVAGVSFVDYILEEKNSNIEKFERDETAQTPALTDYRYIGSNPDNYVYFGCEDNCTDENLYRIIGIIPTQSEVNGVYENRIKLIKELKLGDYHWSDTNHNVWENATLNAILNASYWDTFGEYQKYIQKSIWYLGAISDSAWCGSDICLTTVNFYNQERSKTLASSGGDINTKANIGLMYLSDYNTPWIKKDLNEWFITPLHTLANGYAGAAAVVKGVFEARIVFHSMNYFSVRPTFYLKSDVLYESGNGTQEDPFRINFNE